MHNLKFYLNPLKKCFFSNSTRQGNVDACFDYEYSFERVMALFLDYYMGYSYR